MFGIFMGIWGIVVFMATCVILWHSYGKPYMHRRGKRKWEREQRSGVMTVGQIGTQEEQNARRLGPRYVISFYILFTH
jgi:hypothetical protein